MREMTHIDNAIKLIIDYDYALESESIDGAIEIIIHRVLTWKQRAEAAEARAAELEAQLIGAASVLVALATERDDARRAIEEQAKQLRASCNEVTDDVTRLEWLQSLINESRKHADVLSDGDPDAAFTCFFEVQALHDELKAMLNGIGHDE